MRTRRRYGLAGAALAAMALAAAGGCGGRDEGGGPASCTTAQDCDTEESTHGHLCLDGHCSPCTASRECALVAYYGSTSTCTDGRCRSPNDCTAGTLACRCRDGTSCDPGLVCDGATAICRTPKKCVEGPCAAHQVCADGNPAEDAVCLEACEGEFVWNPSTRACDPMPPECVEAGCSAQHRACAVTGGVAACGDCAAGYVEVGGACELAVSCETLACAAENRECVASPNGHCGGCLAGFVEETATSTCRPVLRCDDLACADYCKEAEEYADAICFSTCGPGYALNPQTEQCDSCAGRWPCDREGETGELEPLKTKTLHCACKTEPGYFFWDTANGGTTRCDKDGDGWLRLAAKIAVENVEDDPTIANTMRCDVPVAGSVVLETRREGDDGAVIAEGDTVEIPLSDPALQLGIASLVLYEADELDDDAKLPLLGLPAYGAGGRPLRAAELNGLAKYCVDPLADFNRNGRSDFNEWDLGFVPNRDSPRERAMILFAYFGELYRSWYEPGAAGQPGKLHLREKLREASSPAGDRVAPAYAEAGAYWQRCKRYRDMAFDPGAPAAVTMDFARGAFRPAGFAGLNHHSQFKCVQVVTRPEGSSGPAPLPAVYATDFYPDNNLPPGGAYQFNSCRATTASAGPVQAAGAAAANPADPVLECTPSKPSSAGAVGWAAVRYPAYQGGAYVRGCINECEEIYSLPDTYWCPGMSGGGQPSPGVYCEADRDNFGKRFCGCGYQYAGPECEIGCPGTRLSNGTWVGQFHQDPSFDLKHRSGWWLCGNVSAGGGGVLSGGDFSLRGSVTAPGTSRTPLSDGNPNGFVLR